MKRKFDEQDDKRSCHAKEKKMMREKGKLEEIRCRVRIEEIERKKVLAELEREDIN